MVDTNFYFVIIIIPHNTLAIRDALKMYFKKILILTEILFSICKVAFLKAGKYAGTYYKSNA